MSYSSHTFICPFRWKITDDKKELFEDQVDMSRIDYVSDSRWVRTAGTAPEEDLIRFYNEKQYFFDFVHPVLYDNEKDDSIVRHFERRELHEKLPVKYHIKIKNREYELDMNGMTLNLYGTGVGMLIFSCRNNSPDQSTPEDVLRINQFGRRIILPFYADKQKRDQTAEYLEISGLVGEKDYREDFMEINPDSPNKPAGFITALIKDLANNVTFEPVIDDRMYVISWIADDELSKKFSLGEKEPAEAANKKLDEFLYGCDNGFWYRYVFVDESDPTCQNDKMYKELIDRHTYCRWQKWGTLYGINRYAMTMLSGASASPHLFVTMDTIYTRMVELALVQRASILRFSAEITRLNSKFTSSELAGKISSLYSSYIRFVNQINFHEVSAQDQAIEMYDMLRISMRTDEQVEKLDEEIGEVFNHISLMEDNSTNKQMNYLSWIATIVLPGSFIVSIFGMNNVNNSSMYIRSQLLWVGCVWFLGVIVLRFIMNQLKKK